MLCCFSTLVSNVQAETKVMTATYFMSFGKSLPQVYGFKNNYSKLKTKWFHSPFSIYYICYAICYAVFQLDH